MLGNFSTSHIIVFALAIVAAAVFAALVLLGAWIDGRRQAIRKRGLHPVTTAEGQVEAIEDQPITRNQGQQ